MIGKNEFWKNRAVLDLQNNDNIEVEGAIISDWITG